MGTTKDYCGFSKARLFPYVGPLVTVGADCPHVGPLNENTFLGSVRFTKGYKRLTLAGIQSPLCQSPCSNSP